MDDLERALRAVLDDPAQMQELRELAGAMGFSAPQPQSVSATAPKAAEPEPKPKPVQAVFQQQPLPEPAAAMLRQAGTNGAGEITAYSVESSNVDLATEFSNMIVTQRAYSAATKIITTADEMLDELTRMT